MGREKNINQRLYAQGLLKLESHGLPERLAHSWFTSVIFETPTCSCAVVSKEEDSQSTGQMVSWMHYSSSGQSREASVNTSSGQC